MTDRRALSVLPEAQTTALLEKIAEASAAGVDWIQIREKDLSAGRLSELARAAMSRLTPSCRVLVNDRLDVACAVGAGGVHLGEKSIPIEEARRFARERGLARDFLIGASVHSLDTAQTAEKAGADYVIFGPVFATPSKAPFGPPQGVERLGEVCRAVRIPVLGIGGISPENAIDCHEHGASGVAGIRIFQEADNLHNLLKMIRGI